MYKIRIAWYQEKFSYVDPEHLSQVLSCRNSTDTKYTFLEPVISSSNRETSGSTFRQVIASPSHSALASPTIPRAARPKRSRESSCNSCSNCNNCGAGDRGGQNVPLSSTFRVAVPAGPAEHHGRAPSGAELYNSDPGFYHNYNYQTRTFRGNTELITQLLEQQEKEVRECELELDLE